MVFGVVTTAVAVLIPQRGKQFRLLFAVHFGVVEQLLNLAQLTIKQLVKPRQSVRVIGQPRIRNELAVRGLEPVDDVADSGPRCIIGRKNLLQQARQLVISDRHRLAGLLVCGARLICPLLQTARPPRKRWTGNWSRRQAKRSRVAAVQDLIHPLLRRQLLVVPPVIAVAAEQFHDTVKQRLKEII